MRRRNPFWRLTVAGTWMKTSLMRLVLLVGEEAPCHRRGGAMVEHDLGVHALHHLRGQATAYRVKRLGECGALALEDALTHHRRDVLVAEDVLRVAQDRVRLCQQLPVGGEDRDRVDAMPVQRLIRSEEH